MASHPASVSQVYKAGASISKGMVVKFSSDDNTVVKGAAVTDLAIGIALNDASSGGDVEVAMSGGAKALAGGTITRGARLSSDANGKVATTTTAGDGVVGIALASGVANDLIPVLVVPSAH